MPVVDVQQNGRRPTGIETPDGVKLVNYVIRTTGPWGGEIAAIVGVSRSGELYKPELPTLSDILRASDMSLKSEPSGSFFAGGIDRPPVN